MNFHRRLRLAPFVVLATTMALPLAPSAQQTAGSAAAAVETTEAVITVGGHVETPLRLTAKDFAGLPHQTTERHRKR